MLEMSNLIWLLLVVFMLHDLEEIITVEGWLRVHRDRVTQMMPAPVRKVLEPSFSMNTAQFAVAVTCIFLILSATVVLTVTTLRQGTYLPVFLVCLHVLFLHVFTHLGQSIRLSSYTPGVVTAVAIVLPYSLYMYVRLLESGQVTWTMAVSTLPFVVLIAPILLGAHWLGKRVR